LYLVVKYLNEGTVDKYVKNDKNYGVSYSRNLGILNCKNSDFLIFCDSDDQIVGLDPNIIIENFDSDIIFFDHIESSETKSKLVSHESMIKNSIINDNQLINYAKHYLKKPNKFSLWISSWSKIFKTSTLIKNNLKFDIKLNLFEDVKFVFDFLFCAKKYTYINQVLYDHFVSNTKDILDSSTFGRYSDVLGMFAFTEAINSLENFLKKIDVNNNYDKEILHCTGAYTIITLLRIGAKINSFKELISVIKILKTLLKTDHFRDVFNFYNPKIAGGDIFIPYLLKNGFYSLALLLSFLKGKKRYSW